MHRITRLLKHPAECYFDFEYDFSRHRESKGEYSVSTTQDNGAESGPLEFHTRKLLVIMIIIIIMIIIHVITENKNTQNTNNE